MEVVKLGIKPFQTVIELYSNAEEMPIHRFNELNKLACIDVGVGSRLEDFNKHFTKLHAYLKNNKVDEAIQETRNIHNNFFYMIEKIGVWSYSFCAFIKSVNGKPYEGNKLEHHHEMIDKLSKKGLTVGKCEEVINEVKKKLIQNLNSTFLTDIAMDRMKTYTQS